ncbi:hypothetical protein AALP_AA5G166400 [Arabis alpina]|uniref:FBD domain-containing protein n=1 Tax=Arabis alpina TaxID=50452 RepID=A0A087GXJ5_ARAAL|nr:hypothetical protein AALP_AA5G166400 [Arabis alpina]
MVRKKTNTQSIERSTVILSKRWRSFWEMQPELIMHLKKQADLGIETVVVCSGLRACTIRPRSKVDWLEPFMCFLQNSPKLKTLVIIDKKNEDFPLSFNLPSCVPACLSTHLEIIKWKGYGGQHGQKQILRYILAKFKKTSHLHKITTTNLQ